METCPSYRIMNDLDEIIEHIFKFLPIKELHRALDPIIDPLTIIFIQTLSYCLYGYYSILDIRYYSNAIF